MQLSIAKNLSFETLDRPMSWPAFCLAPFESGPERQFLANIQINKIINNFA